MNKSFFALALLLSANIATAQEKNPIDWSNVDKITTEAGEFTVKTLKSAKDYSAEAYNELESKYKDIQERYKNTKEERALRLHYLDLQIRHRDLIIAQDELISLQAQLALAKAGKALPVLVGASTLTVGVVSSVGVRIGTESVEKAISLVEKLTPDAAKISIFKIADSVLKRTVGALNVIGKKAPKVIFVSTTVSAGAMIHWYLLAADQVERFSLEVAEAQSRVAQMQAAYETLLQARRADGLID